MNQKGFANIILVVVIVILAGVGGYFVVKKTGLIAYQTPTPTPTQTRVITPTPTPKDEVATWEIYNNNSLGFSIKYPSDAKPSIELDDQYNRLIGFGKQPGKNFEVRLKKDTDPDVGVKYGFLGADVVSKDIKLGGVSGYKAVSTTGYGDAGGQGSPYVEFAARHNGNVYHLIFYGDAIISKEEQQILSTFKFTK